MKKMGRIRKLRCEYSVLTPGKDVVRRASSSWRLRVFIRTYVRIKHY